MVNASRNTSKKKKDKKNSSSSLAALHQSTEATKANHRLAENTTKAYQSTISRARAWLSDTTSPSQTEVPPGVPAAVASQGSWESPHFAHAFDDIPNQHSPDALQIYMNYKAVEQGLKFSTVEQIHAAFKNHWEQM
jgi:hypothetical protein